MLKKLPKKSWQCLLTRCIIELLREIILTNWQQLSAIPFCGFTVCQNSYTDFSPVVGDTNRYAIMVVPPTPCVTTARIATGGETSFVVTKSRSNIKNNRLGSSVGILESEFKNNVIVYPNPATEEITIRLSRDCNNCSLEIVNTLGQKLKSEKLSSLENKISISDMNAGIYFVKIISENKQVFLQKVVVQK